LVLAGCLAPLAGAKVLDRDHAGGGLFEGWASTNVGVFTPRMLGYTIASTSRKPLVVRLTLDCARPPGHGWKKFRRKLFVRPPIRHLVGFPYQHFNYCTYGVVALTQGFPPPGAITVFLTGTATRILH
jgi:hypothetical protein